MAITLKISAKRLNIVPPTPRTGETIGLQVGHFQAEQPMRFLTECRIE
jgi:hypothetical protein